ncbi:hypothetical protein ACFQI3_16335 [Hansschlegelia quercus]|uniref:Type II toxin-antitoxin system HicB family antitoxin n=1 Tax=Hansschlegelia quercus TaxID=2528245 RepID=A0A4Q9GJ73_9HYPH|nr:hypothetical protein [Hansschlegelia quercus]TBN52498.1 hypothetical protein EYR15_11735 [Hansschlegelia quercus]
MSHATIVRVDGRQAGIAVCLEQDQFRFFSTMREAYPVEDGTFGSIAEITNAVRDALAVRRSAWPDAGPVRVARPLGHSFA